MNIIVQIFVDIYLFFYIILFICFGCAGCSLLQGLFSSCSEWGYSSLAVHGLIIVVTYLVVEHGFE